MYDVSKISIDKSLLYLYRTKSLHGQPNLPSNNDNNLNIHCQLLNTIFTRKRKLKVLEK